MHSKEVQIGANLYTVHHNDDWSGEALIQMRMPWPNEEWRLPARLFVVLCRAAVIADAIEALQCLYANEKKGE